MKKNILFIFLIAVTLISCDKIDKPYQNVITTDLNKELFPGNWSDYPWPTFTENSNTQRNIVLEDYTGHKCIYCPAAADIATQLETSNPNRVFVTSIHASPGGIGPFQTTDATYSHDFTNPIVIQYGTTFQNGFGFDANPSGTINRKVLNGLIFQGAGSWNNHVTTMLSENQLAVNIQAQANYYGTTRGLFVHVEVDTMNQNANDLVLVTPFLEESFISIQKFPAGVHDDNYHHHNVLRTTLDGAAFGRTITSGELKANGKYYLDYSFKIPDQYDPTNTHVLAYVMNKNTYEIYHVVKIKYT